MTPYLYQCPRCGPLDVYKPMSEAGRAEYCPACRAPMRREYRVRVQNSTASRDSLKSWGDDWRYDPMTKGEYVARERAARREEEEQ